MRARSGPYARAIGTRLSELHPQLQTYFGGLAPGEVGRGSGVFDVVGTRRRWLRIALRPAVAIAQRRGVVPAGWHTGVAFEIENRVVDGVATATRILHLPSGPWRMRDGVRCTPAGSLIDAIGHPPTVAAAFDVSVDDGGLVLRSTRVVLGWRRFALRIPRMIAPRVTLEERAVVGARQRVSLTIDAPLVGSVYEYTGTFEYAVGAPSDADGTGEQA